MLTWDFYNKNIQVEKIHQEQQPFLQGQHTESTPFSEEQTNQAVL